MIFGEISIAEVSTVVAAASARWFGPGIELKLVTKAWRFVDRWINRSTTPARGWNLARSLMEGRNACGPVHILSSSSAMVESALGAQMSTMASTLSIRRYSMAAALAVSAVEWISTLPNEISFIWSSRMTPVKYLYLASRYFGIAFISANSYLVFGPMSRPPISHRWCKTWFGLSITAGCVSASFLDAVLMLRVYALHLKSSRVGLSLLGLLVVHTGLSLWAGPGTIRYSAYDAICEPQSGPIPFHALAYCISLIVLHVALGALTLIKSSSSRHPSVIVRVVTREAIYATCAICALFSFLIPYSSLTDVPKTHVLFSWPVTFFTIGCCRLIMKTQKMQPGRPNDANVSDVVLTTLRTTMILSEPDTHEGVESDIFSDSEYQE